ncbi:phytanoyl-CoA dioxygenase family protein [Chitinophaga sp. RAB17]|uniref:phytanoyl-CoA dioxygenase family protein n=1 Tax=Chitinophaga sp. RAB17 TaxID=3233049 RepID=UPI003F8F597F
MHLTVAQIEQYHENGYLLLENVFSAGEVDHIRREMIKVIAEDSPRRILEKNGAVRSFFAPDHTNETFKRIVCLKRMVIPSSQLIGSDVYAHQTKINSKSAMIGDWWEWHQDYTFWKNDDGMQTPDVLTAMIYLSDTNEFNGPMLLIPGSHKTGTVNDEENSAPNGDNDNEWFENYKASTFYMTALTADLKYTLKQHEIARWAERKGIVSAKGPAGSVLFFHGNVFHASSNNLSPWDRHTFLVTYNSTRNTLTEVERPRPAFIANRNYEKILPLYDGL